MRYILKNNELCEFSNNMDSLVNNDITEKITNMKTIAEKTEWIGPGRDSFVDYYSEIMTEINRIPTVLNSYLDYLTNVSNDYDDTLNSVQKEIDTLKVDEEENKKVGDYNG